MLVLPSEFALRFDAGSLPVKEEMFSRAILLRRCSSPVLRGMLLAAFGYSGMPVMVGWGRGGDAWLYFSGVWRLGFAAGLFAFLTLWYPGWFFRLSVWRRALRRAFSYSAAAMLASHLDVAFFTLSLRLAPLPVAAALFEAWPIMMALGMCLLFRREGRYRLGSRLTLPLMLTGLLGVALTFFSPYGGLALNAATWRLLGGAALALLGAGFSALGSFGFRYGVDLGSDLPRENREAWEADLFGVVLGQLLAQLPLSAGLLIAGVLWGPALASGALPIAFAGGLICNGVANVCWRWANLRGSDPGLNGLLYAAPLLGLLWLWQLGWVSVARPDYLALGAALITTSGFMLAVISRRA